MGDAYAGEIADVPVREVPPGPEADEFDLGSIGRAIRARTRPILGVTLLALIASFAFVNLVTPRYTGDAEILLESGDNFYTRLGSERDATNPSAPIDDQTVQSQVLLMSSRDLSVDAIRRLKLVGNAEFDLLAGPPRPWTRLLILAGLIQNPANLAPEDRVLDKFADRLRVFPARGSRVINVEFGSADPRLAADAANMVADLYLKAEEGAKKSSTRSAGAWLSGAIEPLRKKVDEAEARVEAFRAANGLLLGGNNVTINTQQLADLNAQLANARAAEADSLSKAKLLRETMRTGRLLDLSEVANNELIRRLSEQRATLSAQMALEGRTLLPQHPRMKELAAQLADLDNQIKLAAEKTVRGLENDARFAGSRVESVNGALDEQKKTSSEGNEKEVELRALERDAKAARDQLEAYMAKYREAAARDEDDKAVPPDARIIARALVPATPSFPRKIPIISIATLGTLILAIAGVVAKEIASPSSGRRPTIPGIIWGKAAERRRRLEPSAGLSELPGEPFLPDGAVAATRADASFDEHRPVATADAGADVEAALESRGEGRPARKGSLDHEARSADPIDLQASGTGEIAGIAAHLLSLKPRSRGMIVLVSRASDDDPTPSFALPLGRDLAQVRATLLIDLDSQENNLSWEAGLAEAQGLSELMANRIGFADAIHRDSRTGLHIVPVGVPATPMNEAMAQEFSVMLQAFALGYDAVLVDARQLGEPAVMRTLLASADVTLVVRGGADETAMAETLERFAAEKPSRLLAVEPAANDDSVPPAFVAA
jgi:polysaccharide biosynthesis transport protein